MTHTTEGSHASAPLLGEAFAAIAWCIWQDGITDASIVSHRDPVADIKKKKRMSVIFKSSQEDTDESYDPHIYEWSVDTYTDFLREYVADPSLLHLSRWRFIRAASRYGNALGIPGACVTLCDQLQDVYTGDNSPYAEKLDSTIANIHKGHDQLCQVEIRRHVGSIEDHAENLLASAYAFQYALREVACGDVGPHPSTPVSKEDSGPIHQLQMVPKRHLTAIKSIIEIYETDMKRFCVCGETRQSCGNLSARYESNTSDTESTQSTSDEMTTSANCADQSHSRESSCVLGTWTASSMPALPEIVDSKKDKASSPSSKKGRVKTFKEKHKSKRRRHMSDASTMNPNAKTKHEPPPREKSTRAREIGLSRNLTESGNNVTPKRPILRPSNTESSSADHSMANSRNSTETNSGVGLRRRSGSRMIVPRVNNSQPEYTGNVEAVPVSESIATLGGRYPRGTRCGQVDPDCVATFHYERFVATCFDAVKKAGESADIDGLMRTFKLDTGNIFSDTTTRYNVIHDLIREKLGTYLLKHAKDQIESECNGLKNPYDVVIQKREDFEKTLSRNIEGLWDDECDRLMLERTILNNIRKRMATRADFIRESLTERYEDTANNADILHLQQVAEICERLASSHTNQLKRKTKASI